MAEMRPKSTKNWWLQKENKHYYMLDRYILKRNKRKARSERLCEAVALEKLSKSRILLTMTIKESANKPGFSWKISYILHYEMSFQRKEKKARTTVSDVMIYHDNAAPHKTTIVS